MNARAWILLVLNVGVLVATGPGITEAQDATDYVSVHLSRDAPLYIEAVVEGSRKVEFLELSVVFQGRSFVDGPVEITASLDDGRQYKIAPESDTTGSFVLAIPPIEARSYTFDMQLALTGEGVLEGELWLEARTESIRKPLEIEIVEWSVD